ncbi:Bet v I/Major latex protein [Arabidopsis thaliana x Arabidopsis arenosa]|uniref:Bet v I/Major latex protein n=1 Tax=Arabidopsis thaliana x Arabidopsis arenosa TaxID=1240361 RepID=A0A8T1Z016_9BRAS|nr:Bet v I/Major latex protein [Arabidopsis thaliana x Arabidopsis arenosa]
MAETTKEVPKSSLWGEVEVEVDIKAPAAKFYHVYAGRPDHVAKATSSKVQACDLLEGEWGTVGSIVNWNYVYAGKAKVAKERIKLVEPEKKLIKFMVIDGDVLAVYKSFLITIQVTPKEGEVGSVVKWHLEYEKNDENVPDPANFLPFLAEMTKEIDKHLLSEE